jgi:hypothetical protein
MRAEFSEVRAPPLKHSSDIRLYMYVLTRVLIYLITIYPSRPVAHRQDRISLPAVELGISESRKEHQLPRFHCSPAKRGQGCGGLCGAFCLRFLQTGGQRRKFAHTGALDSFSSSRAVLCCCCKWTLRYL